MVVYTTYFLSSLKPEVPFLIYVSIVYTHMRSVGHYTWSGMNKLLHEINLPNN